MPIKLLLPIAITLLCRLVLADELSGTTCYGALPPQHRSIELLTISSDQDSLVYTLALIVDADGTIIGFEKHYFSSWNDRNRRLEVEVPSCYAANQSPRDYVLDRRDRLGRRIRNLAADGFNSVILRRGDDFMLDRGGHISLLFARDGIKLALHPHSRSAYGLITLRLERIDAGEHWRLSDDEGETIKRLHFEADRLIGIPIGIARVHINPPATAAGPGRP